MRLQRYIYTRTLMCCMALGFLFTFGCSKDKKSAVDSTPGMVKLNLSISTKSTSDTRVDDTNVLGTAETAINRIRVFAFDGEVLDKYYYASGLNAHGVINISMEVKKNAKKVVYVIINEPLELRYELSDITRKSELGFIDFSLAKHFNDVVGYSHENESFTNSFDIPMTSGEESYDFSTASSASETINVTRSLARVDILLQKKDATVPEATITANTTLVIKNRHDNVVLLSGTTLTTPTGLLGLGTISGGSTSSPIPNVSKSSPLRAFTFYVPEREYITNKLSFELNDLDINGSAVSFKEIVIGTDKVGGLRNTVSLDKIERNKVYKVLCTVDTELVGDVTISGWDDSFVIGDIEDSSSEVVFNVSLLHIVTNSESLDVEYNSTKAVEVYYPTDVSHTRWEKGDASTTPPYEPSWLTVLWSGNTVINSKNTGSVSFTFSTVYPNDLYKFQLRSGGITKTISVICQQ